METQRNHLSLEYDIWFWTVVSVSKYQCFIFLRGIILLLLWSSHLTTKVCENRSRKICFCSPEFVIGSVECNPSEKFGYSSTFCTFKFIQSNKIHIRQYHLRNVERTFLSHFWIGKPYMIDTYESKSIPNSINLHITFTLHWSNCDLNCCLWCYLHRQLLDLFSLWIWNKAHVV